MRVYTNTNNKFNRTILLSHLNGNVIFAFSINGLGPIKAISPIRRVFVQRPLRLTQTINDKYELPIVFIAT